MKIFRLDLGRLPPNRKNELDRREMDEMARRQFENISLNEKRNFSDGPLRKLSVDLIHTYRKINDQYYKSRQK